MNQISYRERRKATVVSEIDDDDEVLVFDTKEEDTVYVPVKPLDKDLLQIDTVIEIWEAYRQVTITDDQGERTEEEYLGLEICSVGGSL